MEGPVLIAETPNARGGHRFLISKEVPLADSAVAAYASKGRPLSLVVGDHEVIVRRKVTQQGTGRPDADETLALVGVTVSDLPQEERQRLVDRLSTFLPQLDEIVQCADWGREERLVVKSEPLRQWVEENVPHLPGCALV